MASEKMRFRFYKARYISELTGRKARGLKELLKGIKEIDDNSLFNHVHHALLDHHFVPLEYPNDFAYWIADTLHEPALAEKIADIDLRSFRDMGELRNAIIHEVQRYLERNEVKGGAPEGQEFHFVKCLSLIFPTRYTAGDIAEAADIFKKIDTNSVFYHFVAHRFLCKDSDDDFVNWVEKITGDVKLANKLKNIDPYGFPSMEKLRRRIARILENNIKRGKA